ncbi:MAG TPA: hypothetical protein VFJ70_00155 [Burkholderiales bacterium]|nr:hypothetical protein [Burkholderiales bacterium]
MALFLLWAAAQPEIGKVRGHLWHCLVHAVVFALLAAVWALGLPRVPIIPIAGAIVLFGFAHEWYEIRGHAHGFELDDAIVDAFGAIAGAAVARLLRRRL